MRKQDIAVLLATVFGPSLWFLLPWIDILQHWTNGTGPCWIRESDKFVTPAEAVWLSSPIVVTTWIVLTGLGLLLLRLCFHIRFKPFGLGAIAMFFLFALVWLSSGVPELGFNYTSWTNEFYFKLAEIHCGYS